MTHLPEKDTYKLGQCSASSGVPVYYHPTITRLKPARFSSILPRFCRFCSFCNPFCSLPFDISAVGHVGLQNYLQIGDCFQPANSSFRHVVCSCKTSSTLTPVLEPAGQFQVAGLTQVCRPAISIASVRSVGHIAVLNKLQEATLPCFSPDKKGWQEAV